MAKSKASKRKRFEEEQPSGDVLTPGSSTKKSKGNNSTAQHAGTISHPLLSHLYPNLQTLRNYVLSKLPASSRIRRKKIASVGLQDDTAEKTATETELALARLLDTTVVGHSGQPVITPDNRWEQWTSFSQKGDESYVTLSDGSAGGHFSQNEVCRTHREDKDSVTNIVADCRLRRLATLLEGKENRQPAEALAL